MQFEFGSFDALCSRVSLPLCAYIGTPDGIAASCYSRSIDIAGYPLLQASTNVLHIVSLFLTAVMIFNIRTKYTAVGRKEMITFFYFFMVGTILETFVISNIVPLSSSLYPYFAAGHLGMISATCWCLFVSGLTGFQFVEDGTAKSLWSLRLSSLVVFGAAFIIAAATFNGWMGLRNTAPMALWIVYFVFNGACIFLYIVLQMVLTLSTLEDQWPIGGILFAMLFATLAQVFYFVVSPHVCELMDRYMDGTFFAALCNLLAVMMVYKYWDSITKEDLEFSVASCRKDIWEIKELPEESEADYPVVDYSALYYYGPPAALRQPGPAAALY